MLKHCVFVDFQLQYTQNERDAVLAGFAEVAADVPGMLDYCFGPNLDFENKSPAYRDGFVVTFENRDALLAYANHPHHVALGARMVAMCNGGYDGIIVFDLSV
ncbi:Dabb family protein [Falsihalocynthiibacter sp. S25ZX9]|uniref:Dabb family protein n=1 Tax=Falsihalocynthiibacter sp. S25ZX9 TaxID=3240870 RepID=UPI0035109594